QLRLRAEAIDHDRLYLAIALQAELSVHAPEAALLGAAEGRFGNPIGDHAVVDHRAARRHRPGQLDAAPLVARPDARVQSVARVVGEPQPLLLVAYPHHGHQRAEALLAHHQHLVVDVGEHGGLVEESGIRRIASASREDAGAATPRVLHVLLDDLELARPAERADVGLAADALAQPRRLVDHAGQELVGHRLRDVDALGRYAHLARIGEGAVHGAVRGALEVGVGAHHHRILAAELERAGHQLAPAGLGDAPPGAHAAGEADLVDAGLDQRRAGLAVAG